MRTTTTNQPALRVASAVAELSGGAQAVASTICSASSRATGTTDTLVATADLFSQAAAQLSRLQSEGDSAPAALSSAVAKLETAALAMSSVGSHGGLTDSMAELLRLQSEQTDQRARLAKDQIKDKFEQLRDQTRKELEAIKKRIAAAKKSSFWGSFIKVFKVIASAATAVAGALTGNPLLITGAMLTLASVITTSVASGPWANAIGMGLGLAGAACCLGSAFLNPEIPGIAQLAQGIKALGTNGDNVALVAHLAGSASTGVAAGGLIGKASADSEAGAAQADLVEVKANKKRALKDAAEEREMLATVLETYQRAMSQVGKVLAASERNVSVAMGVAP